MRRSFVVAGIVGASLLLAAGAGAAAVKTLVADSDKVPPALKIAGAPVGGEPLDAAAKRRADDLLATKVSFVVPASGSKPERVVATATLSDLGAAVDVPRTLQWARASLEGTDVLDHLAQVRSAARGEIDVPLALSFDRTRAMKLVDSIKESEDVDPVSARLDVAAHTVVPEKPGHYVDESAAADGVFLLANTLAKGQAAPVATGGMPSAQGLRVELRAQPFPARMTTDYVKSVDVSQVLSQFETYFSRSGDQARRAKNIETAASKLDGLILPPGELISFNAIVGERSEENGFEKSWEIFKGEMKEGIGGGTCQVASTFHAAALFAGIEILERLPHSRPSAYIPIGLDATVVYPVVDMKMRNPFSFPVALHSTVEKNRLHIEVLGPRKSGHVSFEREILESLPYSRKIEEDRDVPRDKVMVKQHGIRGFRIKRTRELTLEDGKKRVEISKDFYPPTVEIFKVAPGFDLAKLPPLPDAPAQSEDGSSAAGDAPVGTSPVASAAAGSAPASTTVAAAAVPSSASASVSGTSPTMPAAVAAVAPADFQLVDAPGAHAPTKKQAEPDRLLTIKR